MAGDAYARVTERIEVRVRAVYLAEQSDPEEQHFVWAYHVTIENQGDATVQLLRRTWNITDARGRTQVVTGDGVVGQTPVLRPGERFEYSSGAPLATPSGFMTGQYHMVRRDTGEAFDIAIPSFGLDLPDRPARLH